MTEGDAGTPAGNAVDPDRATSGVASPLALAGIGKRLCAAAYEALLLTALLLVASFALLPVISPGAAGSNVLTIPPLASRVALFCSLFALCALYFVWCWTGGRRTLPQKTWHLRVMTTSGLPPSRKTALARYLAAWIGPLSALVVYAALQRTGYGPHALWLFALNFLWAFVDRDRQFLHDRIAGTCIVQIMSSQSGRTAPTD